MCIRDRSTPQGVPEEACGGPPTTIARVRVHAARSALQSSGCLALRNMEQKEAFDELYDAMEACLSGL
eukprot:13565858-Alexandrium_andersonii.AAC.1